MYHVATSQVVLHTPPGTGESNFVNKVSLADAMARLLEVTVQDHWRQKGNGAALCSGKAWSINDNADGYLTEASASDDGFELTRLAISARSRMTRPPLSEA
jgi:hypothetical protein